MVILQGREIKTIILDRDGVLNHDSSDYVKSPAEWQWLDGSIEAMVKLHKAGFDLFIATNQAGIGRGLYSLSDLDAIHTQMLNDIHQAGAKLNNSVDEKEAIRFCPHHPDAGCDCRKPESGLLLQIQDNFDIDLRTACMVGDTKRDLQSAMRVGVLPVHVTSGKQDDISAYLKENNILQFSNLLQFVKHILSLPK